MVEGGSRAPVNHFRGRSDHVLDDKGRLSIATRFRDVLRRQYDERLMITSWHNCLRAYPLPQWEEIEMTLRTADRKNPQMLKLIRWMSGAEECGIDKQGRVLIPPKLRDEGKIRKEIVANGMLTYFEIWDKEIWDKVSQPSPDDFKQFEETLSELGLF
ncbi:MAG: division/cell wall cluster transcriptional repressor MraZ [Deltaproteobacteria bacterium CG23_combo_of_CG06-09_8_20_14_all_60_8]|nr:MAG: division/cell wall cluster transcriptional repressor MraZ [Desulfobacterales bacterium CG2_30_60_27]PIP43535.1 MAG: division/cell wall cluster transcriptional repressor MraZ [Deltaproteobacteria bacterium CG23_combo_of_CG06-09_8_20_14_all_60_8]